jgi:dihydroneopterin aldolase
VESTSESTDQIEVSELVIFARVGVTESERANPQRLALTITVWPRTSFDELQDDISRTVNYSALCVTAHDFVMHRSDQLIETLAAELAAKFLRSFPIGKIRLELRKFVLPDAKYAAVMVTRSAKS